jgi:hypothetical protein
MDIIVTTPKGEIDNAAKEAADCIAAGGGVYFRRFHTQGHPSGLEAGSRIYCVEDGWIRGFAVVQNVLYADGTVRCETTGRNWPPGFYAFMRADSWKWIRPIRMKGFQGFRYVANGRRTEPARIYVGDLLHFAVVVGGWQDAKPETPQ